MTDLQKFTDIPFDEAAANKVNPEQEMFTDFVLNPAFYDLTADYRFHLMEDAPEYAELRVKDLHILHKLAKFLPEMTNNPMNGDLLNGFLNHRVMNTIEGLEALEVLVKNIFSGGPVAE